MEDIAPLDEKDLEKINSAAYTMEHSKKVLDNFER